MELQKPLELIFSFNTLSYLQQRIYNVLIWFAFNESRSSPFNSTHLIKIPLIKNQIFSSIGETNDFYLRNIIKDIVKNKYSYDILNTNKTLDKSLFLQINIENNIVVYKLDSSFEHYFQKTKTSVFLNLENISFLKSKYSLKLYELAQAMLSKDIGSIPINIFKQMMGIDKGYDDIGCFKKKVLDIAQYEICNHTNICIGYFVNTKESIIFLYPKTKEEAIDIVENINFIFADSYIFYKSKKYIYQNIYLSKKKYAFYLVIVLFDSTKELIIKKNSIEELKLFIQKHIIIGKNLSSKTNYPKEPMQIQNT